MPAVRVLALGALIAASCTKDRAQSEPARAVSSEPVSQAPSRNASDPAPPKAATCPNYAECTRSGRIESEALDEISGIAASRTHPEVLYVHNDSGDSPRFFAIDPRGRTLAEYQLSLESVSDVEDIAVGPGPGGQSHVYLGDIGDNSVRFGLGRSAITVYRVPEPPLPEQPGARVSLSGVEALVFQYPHAPHDAETLMVDPLSGDLFLVTKENKGRSLVFRASAPLRAGPPRKLERVGVLEFGRGALRGNPMTTSGDIAPNGAAILIRTYSHLFEWRREPGTAVDQALQGTPRSVPVSNEVQGEAVCYARDSLSYFTVSEKEHQPLYRCGCLE